MILERYHPQVAHRDCRQCQLYQYDERTGKVVQWRGRPLRRLQAQPPPCRTAEGCPKGTPEQRRQLTRRNELAVDHYLRCRATGRFPDDPIVARNAAILRSVEDALQQRNAEELRAALVAIFDCRNA